jgi:Flp pilus assembly pilin Flp
MVRIFSVRVAEAAARTWDGARARVASGVLRARFALVSYGALAREEGQTTAEYALVILAAAAVAMVLLAWAKSSGKLPDFFDKIIDDLTSSVP